MSITSGSQAKAKGSTKMSKHHKVAGKDFSKKTLKALSSKGIAILSATYAPGPGGNYANGEVVYNLDDNGTGRTRSFLQVLGMGK
jgi:hypothetical protein